MKLSKKGIWDLHPRNMSLPFHNIWTLFVVKSMFLDYTIYSKLKIHYFLVIFSFLDSDFSWERYFSMKTKRKKELHLAEADYIIFCIFDPLFLYFWSSWVCIFDPLYFPLRTIDPLYFVFLILLSFLFLIGRRHSILVKQIRLDFIFLIHFIFYFWSSWVCISVFW